MFRAIISPILRSTRLVLPHPGHQQAASSVLYTTSCKHSLMLLRMGENYRPKHSSASSWSPAGSTVGALYHKLYTRSSAPEDERNYRPKLVEPIEIINKIIIVASSWLFILLYQWCTVTQTSNLYLSIFRKSVEKIPVSLKSLHEDPCTFMVASRWILLRMTNISEKKSRREIQNRHFMFNSPPHPPENRVVYEIMRKNAVQPGRPHMTI